ncbi:hypothetical protein BVRB_1g015800 [Beta vulgaris subsp. vulgaris]|nr:hypothetical protein BVRB_1g015800 [Beta vulgaris subsp. vulgaris]
MQLNPKLCVQWIRSSERGYNGSFCSLGCTSDMTA